MFESLTQRLSSTLQALRGKGRLTEDNIKDALREVRIALLEADVALPVVMALIESIKARAIGQEVLASLTPGQALVKIVHDELAAVMAHEINHAVARHGTRQMTQEYGYGLVVQLLLGENPNLLAQLATSLFGKAGTMTYSRSMENQADYLGAETMYKAGYNPEGMVTFFAKLNSMEKESPGKLALFFSSHPLTTERIQLVKNEIATFQPKAYPLSVDNSEFRKIQATVK